MASIEVRLGAKDRQAYELPEVITLDWTKLDDTPYSQLSEWEWELVDPSGERISITYALVCWGQQMEFGKKAIAWLGCKQAGLPVPAFAAFNIHTRQARISKARGSDPLDSGSSTPPSEAAPSETD